MSVTRTERAEQDIFSAAAWYLESNPDDPELPYRFLRAVEEQFARLEITPGIGHPWQARDRGKTGLRYHRVRGFESYLVFYRSHDNGIDVVRVLHGARDLRSLFA